MTKKPIVIGGALIMFGFAWSAITRVTKPISPDLQLFIRREQMIRLKEFYRKTHL
jgi:hypothetical protein